MIYKLGDQQPKVEEGVFIAEGARIIGNVTLKRGSSIWYGAVLRGDIEEIVVGEGSNIQDNSVLHTDFGCPLIIGRGVSVGHSAILHGCQIDDDSLIGMGATLLNKCVIAKESLVAAHALVGQEKQFPPRSLLRGVPAKRVAELEQQALTSIRSNAQHYQDLALKHKDSVRMDSFFKLVVFLPSQPVETVEKLKKALFNAGAGRLGNYSHCSWETHGTTNFLPEKGSLPSLGKQGVLEKVEEVRLETICAATQLKEVLSALFQNHPYETPAFDILSTQITI